MYRETVEGFHIDEYHLTHHAWVVEKLTGTRHELSFRDHPNCVYIGKEFTQDEMIDRSDELLDGPESWINMLTLQEQFEILTQAGYDVELTKCRRVAETEWFVEYGDIVDPSSIDMILGGGLSEGGWEVGWRRRTRG